MELAVTLFVSFMHLLADEPRTPYTVTPHRPVQLLTPTLTVFRAAPPVMRERTFSYLGTLSTRILGMRYFGVPLEQHERIHCTYDHHPCHSDNIVLVTNTFQQQVGYLPCDMATLLVPLLTRTIIRLVGTCPYGTHAISQSAVVHVQVHVRHGEHEFVGAVLKQHLVHWSVCR
jgi:hypothetical protein